MRSGALFALIFRTGILVGGKCTYWEERCFSWRGGRLGIKGDVFGR